MVTLLWWPNLWLVASTVDANANINDARRQHTTDNKIIITWAKNWCTVSGVWWHCRKVILPWYLFWFMVRNTTDTTKFKAELNLLVTLCTQNETNSTNCADIFFGEFYLCISWNPIQKYTGYLAFSGRVVLGEIQQISWWNPPDFMVYY